MNDFFERVAALRRERHSFAVATVVARRAPVSAHLGDRAIVFADGRMEGFVGGACAREIIRRQAIESIAARQGRLVSIQPDTREPRDATAEHVVVAMTCASEGAVDVFVEPFVQSHLLIVVGATPIAAALARLARSLDYEVVRVVGADEQRDVEPESAALGITLVSLDDLESAVKGRSGDRAAVVASQGHYDEQALEILLRASVPYVGLVASRKRGETVRSLLDENGVPGVSAVRSPAGIDIGARTPPEVALSILAEIVQSQASPGRVLAPTTPPARGRGAETSGVTTAVDPVCGMDVATASARHTADVAGVSYYFCCANCRATFLRNPQDYLAHS